MNRVGIDLRDRIIDRRSDYAIGVDRGSGPISSGARGRNAVKKQVQDPVLGLSATASDQQQPTTDNRQDRCADQAAVWWPAAFLSRWVHSVCGQGEGSVSRFAQKSINADLVRADLIDDEDQKINPITRRDVLLERVDVFIINRQPGG